MPRWMVLVAGVLVVAVGLWHAAPHSPAAIVTDTPARATFEPRARSVAPSVEVVYVVGAVPRPGLYRVQAGGRVDDAVRLAGGLREDADPMAVNLAALVSDGEEIAVPRLGQTISRSRSVRSTRSPRKRTSRTSEASIAPASVDLNSADADTLASVPGIGPAIAARIVTYRELNGPFASLDELLDVQGMTSARLDRVTPYLTP